MKRIRETQFRNHPEWEAREGVSGLVEFDGEDQQFDQDVRNKQATQKEYLLQQIEENKIKKQHEQNTEKLYATQAYEINRFRGIVSDDHHNRNKNVQQAVNHSNLALAQQKNDRIKDEKAKKLEDEKKELDLLKLRHFQPA